MQTRWFQLRKDIDVGILKPVTEIAFRQLREVPVPEGQLAAQCVYLDGGGQKGDVPATWAIAKFDVHSDGSWWFAVYAAGRVCISCRDAQFLGADTATCGAA